MADARLYLCSDARSTRGDLPTFLETVLAGGVDIAQLRQKGMEARPEIAASEVFRGACRAHGALFAANDRADVAAVVRPDILHLGQADLPVDAARSLLGSDVLIGRSTHDPAQVDAAVADEAVDYFCVGPTWPTPTKPGRPAPGLPLIEYAAGLETRKPWFAIGGIDLTSLDDVIAAGARRVVVVRAITDAADPGGAAAEFARRLRGA